jgi:hypothetical protein
MQCHYEDEGSCPASSPRYRRISLRSVRMTLSRVRTSSSTAKRSSLARSIAACTERPPSTAQDCMAVRGLVICLVRSSSRARNRWRSSETTLLNSLNASLAFSTSIWRSRNRLRGGFLSSLHHEGRLGFPVSQPNREMTETTDPRTRKVTSICDHLEVSTDPLSS